MTKMSMIQKAARLRVRLKDPQWRRFGALLLTGKLTAVALLLLGAFILDPGLLMMRTFAADPVLKGNDIVNPINTVWTLIAAFLVFGMQVGFTMLEAGFCRSKETVNVRWSASSIRAFADYSSTRSALPSCSATETASSE